MAGLTNTDPCKQLPRSPLRQNSLIHRRLPQFAATSERSNPCGCTAFVEEVLHYTVGNGDYLNLQSRTLNRKPQIPQPEIKILNPKHCLEDGKVVLVEDHPRDGLVGPAPSLQEALKRARPLAKLNDPSNQQ